MRASSPARRNNFHAHRRRGRRAGIARCLQAWRPRDGALESPTSSPAVGRGIIGGPGRDASRIPAAATSKEACHGPQIRRLECRFSPSRPHRRCRLSRPEQPPSRIEAEAKAGAWSTSTRPPPPTSSRCPASAKHRPAHRRVPAEERRVQEGRGADEREGHRREGLPQDQEPAHCRGAKGLIARSHAWRRSRPRDGNGAGGGRLCMRGTTLVEDVDDAGCRDVADGGRRCRASDACTTRDACAAPPFTWQAAAAGCAWRRCIAAPRVALRFTALRLRLARAIVSRRRLGRGALGRHRRGPRSRAVTACSTSRDSFPAPRSASPPAVRSSMARPPPGSTRSASAPRGCWSSRTDGASSGGTLYLRGGPRSSGYAVVVLAATGRTRLLRCLPGTGVWVADGR